MITEKSPLMIFFIILVLCGGLDADLRWLQTYRPFQTPSHEDSYFLEDLLILQDGSFLATGFYRINGELTNVEWGFLMKTDPNGNFIWAVNDSVSYMGQNNNSATVETLSGDIISISYGWGGGTLLKRTPEGERIWDIPYNDFGIESMSLTDDGNIICAGLVGINAAIRLMGDEGNAIWTNVIGNSTITSKFNSVCQTSDGGFALTGLYYYESWNSEVYTVKTNSQGDTLWTSLFDNVGENDTGNSIIEDSNNNLLIIGETKENYNYTYPLLISYNCFGDTLRSTILPNTGLGLSLLENTEGSFTCYSWTGSNTLTRLFQIDFEHDILWDKQLTFWPAEGDRCFREVDGIGYICCGRDNFGLGPIYLALTDEDGDVEFYENQIPISEIKLINYPNPFNPAGAGRSPGTAISYQLSEVSSVSLQIYNIRGQHVKTLVNEIEPAGEHSVIWDGTDNHGKPVPGGVYLYNLEIDGKVAAAGKCVLIK